MICDKDCFNCHYPDCINDKLSLEEYQENVIDVDVPESVKKG